MTTVALILTGFFLREHEVSWSTAFGFSSPRLGRSFSLALVVGVAVLPIVWSLGQLSERLMRLFQIDPAVQETVQAIHTADSLALKFTIGLRVSEEAEVEGLDASLHGEAIHE